MPSGSLNSDYVQYQIEKDDREGSVFVSMDSWIYPALERLAAMGYVPSQNVAIRPWTRQECLRQVRQAEDIFGSYETNESLDGEAAALLGDLKEELLNDQGGFTLESVYGRVGTIAGPALTDGYHIGQTWWADYGRPLGRGSSAIAGYSIRATHGRFFFHNRQEAQRGPGGLGMTPALSTLYSRLDMDLFGSSAPPPVFPVTPSTPAYLRQRPIDLYAGISFAGNALSFGKQELFWGPSKMGPWSFSSNAEPTYNLRFVSTRPHPLPFLRNLGTYKFDVVFGKLSGHKYPARPYFNGQKIDFTIGSNLEISFTRWSLLWGVGHPMTLGSLKRNFFSYNSTGASYAYGERTDPGDRKSGFDLKLHVPGLRKLVTIYADSYGEDELNPIDAPRRVPWSTGIYLARLPGAPHMDFRFEMASSQELSEDEGLNHPPYFINNQYRDANTNKGFILGNAVGRNARAFEGRMGYWKSAKTHIEAGYRQSKISQLFLPGGGTISDGFVNASYALTKEWSTQLFVQRERFLIPAFMAGSNANTSAWLQITWNPKLNLRPKTRP